MDNRLLAVLQRHNPWLEQPSNQSQLLAQSLPATLIIRQNELELVPGQAALVVGPRQAGKTTWIRHCLSRQSQPILLLHAEEPLIRELSNSPAEALNALKDVMTDETILLLEEIQQLKNASLFIKGLVDLEPRRIIVATGSSSFHFKAKIHESLAGRARRTRLLPFSLQEVEKTIQTGILPAIRDKELDKKWEKLLILGGYPKPWLDQKPKTELHHLVEAFVLKDASDFNTIEHPTAFRKLLELSAAEIGNLVNLADWAATAEVSRTAAVRYLDIAADAHIIKMVPPFVAGKRAEVTSRSKIYFLDNGLRNTLFGGFEPSDKRPDKGALWENAVFTELLKRSSLLDQIYFWRTKNGAEVDFVLRSAKRLVAIEVKAGALSRPKLSRAARSFIEAYQPELFCVVNGSLSMEMEMNKTQLLYRRPWQLGDLF